MGKGLTCAYRSGCSQGGAVSTRVGQKLGEGLRRAVGDGDVDGDLVAFFAVDGLEVEGLEELFDPAVGGAGEDITEDRQLVEQGRVVELGGGYVELVALSFQGGAFAVEFAVPGSDPFAQCPGGG